MRRSRYLVGLIGALGIVLTGAGVIALLPAASEWRAEHVPIHMAIVAVGALFGLGLAGILLVVTTHEDDREHHAWIIAGLAVLAILDFARTSAGIGEAAAWLHRAAPLADALDGVGLLAAASWLFIQHRARKGPDDGLLAWFCLLLGVTVILGGLRPSWSAVWWSCQVLRLAMYGLVFAHYVGVYRKTNERLRCRLAEGRQAQERLRDTIRAAEDSERELCGAIGDLQCSEAALMERVAELVEARDSALQMMQNAEQARTKAERAQASLQAEEQRLRAILDSIQAGVLVIDDETHLIVEANLAALKMMGACKAEVIGRQWQELIDPEEHCRSPIMDADISTDHSERVVRRRDGQSIPVLRTVIPAMLNGHKHLLDSFVDISERKQAELELLHSNAIRADQARALAALLEFSQSLLAIETRDEVLDKTVSVAAKLTASRRVSVMLPDEENRYLTIAKSIGIDPHTAADVRIPIGRVIAGRVFQSGESVVINSPEEVRSNIYQYDSMFFASMPLISKALTCSGKVMGVLNITERENGHPFEPAELEYVDLIRNMTATVINDIDTRQARDRAQGSIVVALAKLADYRDSDTGRHLDRVTKYAVILAQELQTEARFGEAIDEQFLRDIERAMPLHDIGKVAIPDQILLKPGKLTPGEMSVMMTHAEVGARTIRSVIEHSPASFLQMAEEIAWGHHERYDGRGYPRKLKGEGIAFSARIAAVADVYDALTTKRVYKDPMPHEKAAAIILEGSGSQFDTAVVEAFLRREDEFIRLAVELADEAIAAEPLEAAIPLS